MAIQHETAKTAGDALSLVTVVGTLAEVLPAIAALLTIVWTVFRIYETPTVTKWISLWRQRNNVKED
jgi:hypothetical protein